MRLRIDSDRAHVPVSLTHSRDSLWKIYLTLNLKFKLWVDTKVLQRGGNRDIRRCASISIKS